MSEVSDTLAREPGSSVEATEGRAARTASAVVRCDGCGAELDGLRAGHVAIFDAQTRYFCGFSTCRRTFLGLEPELSASVGRASRSPSVPPSLLAPVASADEVVRRTAPLPDAPRFALDELIEPVATSLEQREDASPVDTPTPDMGGLLLGLTLVAGLLAMALEMAAPSSLVHVARLLLVGVAVATIAGHAATARGRRLAVDGSFVRDEAAPHWSLAVVAPVLGFLVAVAARLSTGGAFAERALFLASTIVVADAIVASVASLAARPTERRRAWLLQRLGGGASDVSPPGREVVLRSDALVPADVEVVEGDAVVASWVSGASTMRRRAGDVVAAGLRIVSGELRGRVLRAGTERALLRSFFEAARRPEVDAEVVRGARRLAVRFSPLFAVLAAGSAYAFRAQPIEVVMVAVAVHAALSSAALVVVPGLTVARGTLEALDRGILYGTAAAWDRAGRATAAVFCARGTLLRGEPELVEIELFGGAGAQPRSAAANGVLALAASALASESTPTAFALRRAARERGLAADLVRNTRSHEGRGVTGVGATGEAVVVGTRELMVERRVSVAAAEGAMAKLEAAGRTVLLVARSGRLFGVCALQDGLRPGARAAVQHLLDARIEPVLMSPDTAATCEAIGRALDIDHLRAEVREDERGAAVQRLRDVGARVVVLGHAKEDDAALRTADVAVVLGGVGRATEDPAARLDEVATVTDDVRDAALAVALAQRWRARASTAFLMVAIPAGFGSLVVAGRLLPPEYAPIAQLLGAISGVWPLLRDGREV
ncbi:MAG: HAD family hydrolase [Deltaproteobacteria bacterium]|nr:HAD family hydrolase [Deltaproteobacteria bacterium]